MQTKNKKNEKLILLVYAGLFAAMTTLLTATLHIPIGNGYIHCGDAVIYLSAAMLPMPYAVGASAIGGMMADIISGYPMYAIPTFIIKALLALTFSLIGGERKFCARRVVGLVACGLVTAIGYWIAEAVLYGSWIAQFVATVPASLIQAAGSAVVYAVVAMSMERMRSTLRTL